VGFCGVEFCVVGFCDGPFCGWGSWPLSRKAITSGLGRGVSCASNGPAELQARITIETAALLKIFAQENPMHFVSMNDDFIVPLILARTIVVRLIGTYRDDKPAVSQSE
jgi:hypothetical protein